MSLIVKQLARKCGLTRALAALAMALILALTAPVAGAVGLDFELGMRHEENLTRAESNLDKEHDTAVVLGARVERLWRIDHNTIVALESGLAGNWWTRFDALSVLAADVGVRARHRLGIDFTAPWLEASLGVTGLKHRDSEIRDGGVARAGLTAGRRFAERFDARLGYAYQMRRALSDVVFDLEQHEVFAQLDVQLGPRWLLYFEFNVIEGELVSTASLPNPRIRAHANAVPVEVDAAFGRGVNPVTGTLRPRWTYQIDGVVLGGEAGINYPLIPGLAIDVAARYVQANAAGPNSYNGYIVNAGLLWRF